MFSDDPEQRDIRARLYLIFLSVHFERNHGHLLGRSTALSKVISLSLCLPAGREERGRVRGRPTPCLKSHTSPYNGISLSSPIHLVFCAQHFLDYFSGRHSR